MQSNPTKSQRGFTLLEILFTVAIFGLVSASMYGLYLNMQRTTVNQEEIVDVQQNLRIALDMLSRDLKMSGALVPDDDGAFQAGSTGSQLSLNTGSSRYNFALLASNPTTGNDIEVAAGTTKTTTVTFPILHPSMTDAFDVGDAVRIIRPQDGKQPYDGEFEITQRLRNPPSPQFTSITVTGFDNPAAPIQYRTGDVLVRVDKNPAPPALPVFQHPTGITWDVVNSQLRRTVIGDTPQVVAEGITALELTYYTDIADGDTAATPLTAAAVDDITAVLVTLRGIADNQMDGVDRQRTISTVVRLRN